MNAHTRVTCRIGTVGTLYVMIGFGIGAENFAISGAFLIATSFISSDSQKKENSETGFGCGDAGDAVILDGEATSFMSSASGFQKKGQIRDGFRMHTSNEEISLEM